MIRSLLSRLRIRAVPTVYGGIRFRSTLEADYAALFDELGIDWAYEPLAVRLTTGDRYLPDFYLPGQRTYVEVKGPHGVGIEKPINLDHALELADFEPFWCAPRVLIGEAGGRLCNSTGRPVVSVVDCQTCDHTVLLDLDGPWHCRICGEALGRWPGFLDVPWQAAMDRRRAGESHRRRTR